jgi:hypothetical protein
LPPFGSVGSGLASYRDMTNVLRDEKEIKYSPTIGRQNNAKATNTPPHLNIKISSTVLKAIKT